MKRWLLLYMRFDAALDLYCGQVSGNKLTVVDAIQRIAKIDHDLDLLEIGALK